MVDMVLKNTFRRIVLAGVLAKFLIPGQIYGQSVKNGYRSLRDSQTGIVYYVESDGAHVVALDPAGKILWVVVPHNKSSFQSLAKGSPTITQFRFPLSKDEDTLTKFGNPADFIIISYGSYESGILKRKNGDLICLINN